MQPTVQNQEQKSILPNKTTPKFQGKLVTIHQLDCIYFGEINRSYQKEGFGILQTIEFQTFFGFWKAGNADGLGIVVYPNGQIIYGHFYKNQLSGMAVVDDHKILRVGIFEGIVSIGIVYEYQYESKKWKMIKYNHGLPVNLIKEQGMPLSEGLPTMITADHSICLLLQNYLSYHWFESEENRLKKLRKQENKEEDKQEDQEEEEEEKKKKKRVIQISDKYADINSIILGQNTDKMITLGFKDKNQLNGLGVVYDTMQKRVIETGFYQHNKLKGYGYTSPLSSQRIIGPYTNGMKHGIFLQVNSSKTSSSEYRNNSQIAQADITEDLIKKKQKAYNYEQKDFLYAKNGLELNQQYLIILPSETKRFVIENINKSETSRIHSINQEKPVVLSNKKKAQLPSQKISHTYINEINENNLERSSVVIMRQKLNDYKVFDNQEEARRNSAPMHKKKMDYDQMFEIEEGVAIEENPFDSVVVGKNLLNQSPKRRH